MSEGKIHLLINLAGVVGTTIGVLGLAALGVRGIGLSFGALIPLFITASASARVVMHYDDTDHR